MRFLLTIILSFLVIHFLIAYNLPTFINNAHFPYEDLLRKYFNLYPFTPFANFDGYQYISIAKNGYGQFQQSYFPLFPFVIFVINPLFSKNYILSGIFINILFLVGGLIFFKKYLTMLFKSSKQTRWAILFLISFPTAFFYQIIYPESLFLFLSAAYLYFLIKKKYSLATIFVFFASLTKIQGALLIIPFFLTIFASNKLHVGSISLQTLTVSRQKIKRLFFALSPLYGLLAYSVYLFITYKDPLYYYHAQSAFGANRATDKIVLLPQVLYRYIKIFLHSQINFTYWIAFLEFGVFLLVFGVLVYELFLLLRKKEKDMMQISLNLYSLAAIVLPTLTGTLTSVPRYALISFGFFVALAKINNWLTKTSILLIFAALQIILFIYFLKGYFIS